MINNCNVEGYVYRPLEQITWSTGKIGWAGTVAVYRSSESRSYDFVPFRMTDAMYQKYKDDLEKKGVRILVTGTMRSAKDTNGRIIQYILVEYISICVFQSDTKYREPKVKPASEVDTIREVDGQVEITEGEELPF